MHCVCNGCDRPLFMNRHHAAYTRKDILYILKKYEKRAREVSSLLPDFTISPHFRHPKAMHPCQAGFNLIYIRDILGHVDIATTEVIEIFNSLPFVKHHSQFLCQFFQWLQLLINTPNQVYLQYSLLQSEPARLSTVLLTFAGNGVQLQ